MRTSHYLLGVGLLLTVGLSLPAQSKPGSADLPIKRIILFSSGVGYFQRDGQVDGDSKIELQFPAADVNDLLKSLILQDLGGGHINAVNYDNRNPIDMTL